MGNHFGIHGLGTESVHTHSIRDDSDARISEVSRPTEVPVLMKEVKETTRSEFGLSCHDPEACPEVAASYSGAQNVGQETKKRFLSLRRSADEERSC